MNNLWNKDDKIMQLVVEHYNIELLAANTYLCLATISKKIGYDNLSKFFLNMAYDKQTAHMPRIIKYLMQFDELLNIDSISLPINLNSNNVKDVLEIALKTESKVRDMVKKLAISAHDLKDFETFAFIQWFVNDSIEDLEMINDIYSYVTSENASLIQIESIIESKLNKKDC